MFLFTEKTCTNVAQPGNLNYVQTINFTIVRPF